MAELALEIEGMHCASCAQTIERTLGEAPGVKRATINLALNRGQVEFDPAVTGPEKIVAAVASVGYGARAAESVDLARALEEDLQAARREKIALAVSALAAVPLLVWDHALGGAHGTGALALEGALATLGVLVGGWPFFTGAVKTLAHRRANMDVLVALGAAAALSWSWLAVLVPGFHVGHHLSFAEAALLVFFVRGGKALEGRARVRAREALRALVAREPKTALVRVLAGETRSVPVAQLAPGDEIVVRAGETVPADGLLIEGASTFDESFLTGESIPVERVPGEVVPGGAIVVSRPVVIRAVRTGEETALRRVARLVVEAQAQKAPIQRFADRAAGVFVPIVLLLAVATGAAWAFFDAPAVALARAVAVLVVACPCALGLATPAAILVGTGVGLRHGILVRGAPILEALGRVATVLLDKTGTLTEGKPRVVAVRGDERAIAFASALEARSTHPLARALVQHVKPAGTVSEPEELGGLGIHGRVEGIEVLVGRSELLDARGVKRDPALLADLPPGSTLVHVALEGIERAVLALRDEPRPEAREAVERLRSLGVELAVLSGDREDAVQAVASALGIADVQAGLAPEKKLGAIARRKALAPEGRLVAMVGDGINDAPALARADVGIALGKGTDVAKEAGSVVLTRDDLRGVADAIELGRATLRKIRQNLVFAVVYNVLGIPLAAGVFARWGIELTPAFAGLAMALSSASVVGNALLLGRFEPRAR